MTPNLSSYPRLAPGCSVAQMDNQRVLRMPGRDLRLSGPSLEIVSRCDGRHTVQQIISEMQKIYSRAQAVKVEEDILGYLRLLHDQHALEFLP